MSRSYRKNPVGKDHNYGMKQCANKKVRRVLNRNPELRLKGKEYKKLFESYDICDYWFPPKNFEEYFQSAIKRWHEWQIYSWGRKEPFPDRKECYRDWIKYHRGK